MPKKDDHEQEARMEKFILCVNATHKDAKGKGLKKGNGGQSELPCPSGCGGTLRYSVASVNGHIWGSCTTKGCVSWME